MKLTLVALIILLLMVPAYGQQAAGNVSSKLLQGLAGLTMPVYGQQTVEYWFNKGNGFFDNGVYDLAIKFYDEVILIDPNHATAWNNKGYALYSQGNFDAAIKAYDEALRLNPNFAAAQNNKVLALGRLGQRAEPAMYSDPWMNSQPSNGATGHTYHGTTRSKGLKPGLFPEDEQRGGSGKGQSFEAGGLRALTHYTHLEWK